MTRKCWPGNHDYMVNHNYSKILESDWLSPAMIYNGNRTEWSPIRSVIIRVINKIGRPRSGSPICLITSMITTELDDTKSCYQLIISITKFEKEKGGNVPEKE